VASFKHFDAYTRRARLAPCLLVGLPLAVDALLLAPMVGWVLTGVGAACAAAGLTFIFAGITRDIGKRDEIRLLRKWQGFPTRRYLRHSDSTLNSRTKTEYHAALAALSPAIGVPSKDFERLDARAADDAYDAHVNRLRAATRNIERFPLVAEENREYGFRRNTRALRPLGITVSASATALAVARVHAVYANGLPVPSALIALLVFEIAFLLWWMTAVNDTWVERAANLYALRLLEASTEVEGASRHNS